MQHGYWTSRLDVHVWNGEERVAALGTCESCRRSCGGKGLGLESTDGEMRCEIHCIEEAGRVSSLTKLGAVGEAGYICTPVAASGIRPCGVVFCSQMSFCACSEESAEQRKVSECLTL